MQQTATAQVLQVINGSSGDLGSIFGAILDSALRLCKAAFGGLLRFDGECFYRAAVHNLPEALARRSAPLRPAAGMALDRIRHGDPVVHIADIADDPADRIGHPGRVALVELGGARTAVWVRLEKDGELLGALVAYRREVRPFTDREIGLLQNFAAEAVIAIENARLLAELRARTEEIAAFNRRLEIRAAAQLAELERIRRLKRFLPSQLVDFIVARGDDSILQPHRREIVVAFCDLRGFTAFADAVEPEEVHALLSDYHATLDPVVTAFDGTLDHFSGDGLMVFFNDPLPCSDPAIRAVQMASEMRDAVAVLQAQWRRRGYRLGFGIGIAQGTATLGQIGFAERIDYSANGAVCNLAARLCAEALDGQILIADPLAAAVQHSFALTPIGDLYLKGLRRAVFVHDVAGSRQSPRRGATQAAAPETALFPPAPRRLGVAAFAGGD
jgi:adenylate cyclase